jgi:quinol monooxygenase YgiN
MSPRKSDLVVVASAKAKPGKENDLEQALRAVAAPTRAQPGSVAFSLYRAAREPGSFIALERWSSAADHDQHLHGAHVQALISAMGGILAEPPQIIAYEIVDEE